MHLKMVQAVKMELRQIIQPEQLQRFGHMTGTKLPKMPTSEDSGWARDRVGAVTAVGGIMLRSRAPRVLTFQESVTLDRLLALAPHRPAMRRTP